MSYRPQIKKSDGTMQDLPLDAETIKGQEVKGLAFKDTIKNDDIANDAAIAQSKVSGLSTSLSAKIDKSGGELKDTVVTFDDVSGMAPNIASGETAKTLFGKIKNWFGRLKTLAFKDTIKNADIASDAAIAQNKIYGLRTDYVASLSVSGKTVTYKNKIGVSLGTITTQDTTYSNATTVYDGLMSSEDKTKLNGIDSNANNYTLPQATRAALGGVKIGYTKNGDNYPVQLSSSGQMFVTVSGGGGGSGGGGDSTREIVTTLSGSIGGTVVGGGSGNYVIDNFAFYEDRIIGLVTIYGGGGAVIDYIGAMLDFMNHPINGVNSIFEVYSISNGDDYNFDLTLTSGTDIDIGGYTGKYVLLKDCSGFASNLPRIAFIGDTELNIADFNSNITEDIECRFTLRFSPRV